MRIDLKNGKFYTTTDAMDGKMTGMKSLNTSPSLNPNCLKMQKTRGTICVQCYSNKTEARWPNARAAWRNNYHTLTENLLELDELYTTREDTYRLSAHGDIGNRIHYLNYVSIVKNNPQTIFSIWTKRLDIIKEGGLIQLPNLIHIYSAPKLNPRNVQLPAGFDKVFNVYTYDYAKKHNIDINCGARNCKECGICYAKNGITIINEVVKRDHKKLMADPLAY